MKQNNNVVICIIKKNNRHETKNFTNTLKVIRIPTVDTDHAHRHNIKSSFISFGSLIIFFFVSFIFHSRRRTPKNIQINIYINALKSETRTLSSHTNISSFYFYNTLYIYQESFVYIRDGDKYYVNHGHHIVL